MSSYFCLTVRFLQPYYHGRSDGGEPEWPPSPLRAFQALVAAAARRWRGIQFSNYAAPELRWLEQQPTPTIVSAKARLADSKYRLYVPDNTGDLTAAAWSRGDTTRIIKRTEKDIRPMHLPDLSEVHYLFTLGDGICPYMKELTVNSRSISHLGLGIDMVVGNAAMKTEEEVAQLSGDVWQPVSDTTGTALRIPIPGTLNDLIAKHQAFLNRIGRDDRGNESFNPVPPLSAFRVIGYRRSTDPPQRRFAVFSLLKPDASGYRAFDTARKGLTVAGMMRCAMKKAAEKSRPENLKWVEAFVLGHGEVQGQPHKPVGPKRFAYIPLPSIEFRGEGRANVVGPIRRMLITVLADGHQREIDWAGQAMSGVQLIDERKEPQATLSRLPTNDKMVQRYIRASSTWATVTPVVLPGYDDPSHYRRRLKNNSDADNQKRWLNNLHDRIDALIRKAIGQAGFSDTLKQHAIIEWRMSGFWPGTELASRYGVPDHLQKFSRYHVRIQWRDANDHPVQVPGPICIGGGRFYGLGLFAGEKEEF